MGFFDIFRKPTKKEVNRERTQKNRQQGRDGESQVKAKWQLRGYEVKRTGRGHDFYVIKRDPLTGKVIDSKYVEAKNGKNAKLSPLQKKMKKKYRSRYVEDRVEPSLISRIFSNGVGSNSSSKSKKPRKPEHDSFNDMWGIDSSSKSKKPRKPEHDSFNDMWGIGTHNNSNSGSGKTFAPGLDRMFGIGSSSTKKGKKKSDGLDNMFGF